MTNVLFVPKNKWILRLSVFKTLFCKFLSDIHFKDELKFYSLDIREKVVFFYTKFCTVCRAAGGVGSSCPEVVCTDDFLSRKPSFLLSAMHCRELNFVGFLPPPWFSCSWVFFPYSWIRFGGFCVLCLEKKVFQVFASLWYPANKICIPLVLVTCF